MVFTEMTKISELLTGPNKYFFLAYLEISTILNGPTQYLQVLTQGPVSLVLTLFN